MTLCRAHPPAEMTPSRMVTATPGFDAIRVASGVFDIGEASRELCACTNQVRIARRPFSRLLNIKIVASCQIVHEQTAQWIGGGALGDPLDEVADQRLRSRSPRSTTYGRRRRTSASRAPTCSSRDADDERAVLVREPERVARAVARLDVLDGLIARADGTDRASGGGRGRGRVPRVGRRGVRHGADAVGEWRIDDGVSVPVRNLCEGDSW